MKLTLTRQDVTDRGIFGHMDSDMGNFSCVTLERHDIAIPAGSYGIDMYNSPEHGLVPILTGVPNRYYIEIHEGNWEYNSKGCILVGSHRDVLDKTMIVESKITLKALVELIKDQKDVTLTII